MQIVNSQFFKIKKTQINLINIFSRKNSKPFYIRSETRIHTCHCLSKIYRHTKGRWTRWCTYRTESLRTYITYNHRWKRQQRPRHSVRGCHRGKPAQGVTTVDRDRPRCPRDLTIKLISPPTRSAASFFTSLLHSRSSFVPRFTSPLHTWSICFIRYPYDVESTYELHSPTHLHSFFFFKVSLANWLGARNVS